jgi:hypothetical protein
MSTPPVKNDDPYQLLAEAGDISVYRCEQGCLHLQVGSVNLRLEDDEFRDLVSAISEAAALVGGPRVSRTKYGRVQ